MKDRSGRNIIGLMEATLNEENVWDIRLLTLHNQRVNVTFSANLKLRLGAEPWGGLPCKGP